MNARRGTRRASPSVRQPSMSSFTLPVRARLTWVVVLPERLASKACRVLLASRISVNASWIGRMVEPGGGVGESITWSLRDGMSIHPTGPRRPEVARLLPAFMWLRRKAASSCTPGEVRERFRGGPPPLPDHADGQSWEEEALLAQPHPLVAEGLPVAGRPADLPGPFHLSRPRGRARRAHYDHPSARRMCRRQRHPPGAKLTF